MNIDLQARDFQLTDPFRQQVKRKLKVILSRFDEKIHMVRIVLSDINGPKGGNDKRCVIKIKVSNRKTLVIDEVTSNIQESINRCARRAKHAITRLVSRNRRVSRDLVGTETVQTNKHRVDKLLEEEFEIGVMYSESQQFMVLER